MKKRLRIAPLKRWIKVKKVLGSVAAPVEMSGDACKVAIDCDWQMTFESSFLSRILVAQGLTYQYSHPMGDGMQGSDDF